MNGLIPAPDPSPVASIISVLQCKLCDLEEALARLSNKLIPVLSPEAHNPAGTLSDKPTGSSGFYNLLDSAVNRLNTLIADTNQLTLRCEL
jgi:hypothetical protein